LASKKNRTQKQVAHSVPAAPRNFIWRELNGIFRPVKTPEFEAAEKAAKGRKLPDPRAGEPTHRTREPRVPRARQEEIARELGYEPVGGPATGGAKEPIYYKRGGDPPYISADRDMHGAARGDEAANIPWKGATSQNDFGARTRAGTYVPKYDADGNVVFDRVRR
jgi:hypothetical protein